MPIFYKFSVLLIPIAFMFASISSFATPVIKVTVSAPKGSAAADFSEKLMSNIIYTPCFSKSVIENTPTIAGELINNSFDQLTIKLEVTNEKDTNDNYLYDLYFMIVNLSANGSLDDNIIYSQIYLFERDQNFTDKLDPVSVILFGTAESVDNTPSEKTYLAKENFIATKYEEFVLGSSIYFDAFSLSQGTWMALAILSDSSLFKLADPKTWAKWDAGVFVLGSPLKTSIGTTNSGLCE